MKAVRETVENLVGGESLVGELVKGVGDHWRDRAANPLSAAFLVFAAAFNYKLILVIISFEPVATKLALIERIYSTPGIVWQSTWRPMVAALFYVFIYAFVARMAHRAELGHKRKLLEARHLSDGVTLLTKDESRHLRAQSIQEAVRHQHALTELTEARDSYHEQMVVAVGELRELRLKQVLSEPREESEESRELAGEIVDLRTRVLDLEAQLDFKNNVIREMDPRSASSPHIRSGHFELLNVLARTRASYTLDELSALVPMPRTDFHQAIGWMEANGYIALKDVADLELTGDEDFRRQVLFKITDKGIDFFKAHFGPARW